MSPFGPSDNAVGQFGREFGPHATPATPAQAAKAADDKSGKTVTMVFPKEVTLTTDSYKRIKFPAGVHAVPAALADHPYLEQCGVRKHQVNTARLPEPEDDEPEDEETDEVTIESLQKLTKAELIALGKDQYGLELDPVSKKDDLIISIMEAVEKGQASA